MVFQGSRTQKTGGGPSICSTLCAERCVSIKAAAAMHHWPLQLQMQHDSPDRVHSDSVSCDPCLNQAAAMGVVGQQRDPHKGLATTGSHQGPGTDGKQS